MPKAKKAKAQSLSTFAAMTKGASARAGTGKRTAAGVKVVAPKRTANPVLQASKLGVPPNKVKKGKKRY